MELIHLKMAAIQSTDGFTYNIMSPAHKHFHQIYCHIGNVPTQSLYSVPGLEKTLFKTL